MEIPPRTTFPLIEYLNQQPVLPTILVAGSDRNGNDVVKQEIMAVFRSCNWHVEHTCELFHQATHPLDQIENIEKAIGRCTILYVVNDLADIGFATSQYIGYARCARKAICCSATVTDEDFEHILIELKAHELVRFWESMTYPTKEKIIQASRVKSYWDCDDKLVQVDIFLQPDRALKLKQELEPASTDCFAVYANDRLTVASLPPNQSRPLQPAVLNILNRHGWLTQRQTWLNLKREQEEEEQV